MRSYDSIADLLHFLLYNACSSVAVFVCSDKKDFLEQVLLSTSPQSYDLESTLTHEEDKVQKEQKSHVSLNDLLQPTLRSIVGAEKTRLQYCTDIDSLRARLSVLTRSQLLQHQAGPQHVTSVTRPLLLILDMLLLHHQTSEFSVQGLSRTFAIAIETAARESIDLIFSETNDVLDPENTNRGPRLWKAQVPILSESVKIGPEGSSWARREVSVQTVAERWIEFPSQAQEQALDTVTRT